ncbi:cation:proton antiporter [Uliginosibacterium sp. H3]|uniref:Cation:proton antiporter n=1 Tax=Uliginosibacterium silvisoli TaxID=3114758 RepID=A0ABU6K6Z5_9RHOO|nr:cation:proton antiporter [Uliginosibacterium sp. H3]
MHHALDLILLLLAAAVAVVILFRSLNLPPVLGYLAIGAALGPNAAGLVPDTEQARYLAEFGVVFLMFTIGLEFSLGRLFAMKRLVFGVGGLQVVLTVLLGTAFGKLFGLSGLASFALASAIAMSSTAVLSKLLADRMQLDTPHGREVLGVLLFQDVAVVPLLILIPALGQKSADLATVLGWAALKAVVVLTVLLFLGHRLMRPWFLLVARRRSSELFMLNILLITLGLAWVTERAGLSLALGAFLAGMLISETEFRFEVEEDIKPFRDVLLGFFMVTVGMFLDVGVIVHHFLIVLGVLVLILVAKFGVVFAVSRMFNATTGTAVRSGLWLCAGGEFGFVLLTQISDLDIGSARAVQITVAALVLSMLIAPLIVQMSDRIVMRFVKSEWLLRSMELTKVAAQSIATEKHVIICGYGRSGQYLARFLEKEELTYVALDLDPDRVRSAASAGDTVVFGDCSRRETLVAAGLMRASAVVVSFNDVPAAMRVLHHVQAMRPDVPVVARAADDADMERLMDAGAVEVVPEMLETSIMLASHVLALIGMPLSRVIRSVRDIRNQRYSVMRGFFHGASDAADRPDALQERLYSLALQPGAYSIGKRLDQLKLDTINVTVTAIRRRGIRGVNPVPETQLEAGDVLVLLGVSADLSVAELRLLKGG